MSWEDVLKKIETGGFSIYDIPEIMNQEISDCTPYDQKKIHHIVDNLYKLKY